MQDLYLGIDASTQSLTAAAINPQAETVDSVSINFDKDLPEYKTQNGVCSDGKNPNRVWSYPEMWAEALDALFEKLAKKTDIGRIKAIGGAGQQHASVWLKSSDAFKALANAPKGKLADTVKVFLSRRQSPVWLDTSTSAECAEIENAVGVQNILLKTGSAQTERFTGAQIRKIAKEEAGIYAATKRIHLNSSFMTSLLCNEDMTVDFCDAAGMNLLNVGGGNWDEEMLRATANGLIAKLPKVAKAMSVAGKIGSYFCRHYGFRPDTRVVAFTGDNPSSLVGCGASSGGNAVISLGTSATLFCANKNYAPIEGAHVFGNPAGKYMNLMCFRNGALAREKLAGQLGVGWDIFDNAFENYSPDGLNDIILPFYLDEISPKIKSGGIKVFIGKSLSATETIRLFIEGQIFNMKLQAESMKAEIGNILITGGASKSGAMAQCISNVFNGKIYILKNASNSSALGGAMIAARACGGIPLAELENRLLQRKLVAVPNKNAAAFYREKIKIFAQKRQNLISSIT